MRLPSGSIVPRSAPVSIGSPPSGGSTCTESRIAARPGRRVGGGRPRRAAGRLRRGRRPGSAAGRCAPARTSRYFCHSGSCSMSTALLATRRLSPFCSMVTRRSRRRATSVAPLLPMLARQRPARLAAFFSCQRQAATPPPRTRTRDRRRARAGGRCRRRARRTTRLVERRRAAAAPSRAAPASCAARRRARAGLRRGAPGPRASRRRAGAARCARRAGRTAAAGRPPRASGRRRRTAAG